LVFQKPDAAVWLLCLQPGKRTSLHKHERKVTQLIVVSGKICVEVGGTKRVLSDGQDQIIKRGVPHQTENQSLTSAYLIEIEYPNDKFDLVRISDDFGRKGQGYENQSQFVARRPNHDYIDFSDTSSSSVISKRIRDTRIHFLNSDFKYLQKFFQNTTAENLRFFRLEKFKESFSQENHLILEEFANSETSSVSSMRQKVLALELDVQEVPGYDKLTDGIIDVFSGVIFGTLGDSSLHFGHHAARVEGIEIDLYRSDRTASLAAEGHSFIAQIPTVLFVSSENGLIDAFKAISNCFKDKTPLIVLRFSSNSTESRAAHIGITKRLDSTLSTIGLFGSIKELKEQDFMNNNLSEILSRIWKESSLENPGPVLVSVSLEVITNRYPKHNIGLPKIPNQISSIATTKIPLQFGSVIDNLSISPRPLIVLGRGVRIECNDQEISKFTKFLAELRIPVVTTRSGIDLVDHERASNFGRVGTYGVRYSNFILHEAETILFLGTSLSQAQTGKDSHLYAEKARKILVSNHNQSLEEIDGNFEIFNAQISEFVKDFLTIQTKHFVPKNDWFNYCSFLKMNYSQDIESPTEIRPQVIGEVLKNVTSLVNNGVIFCVDGGSLLHHFTQNAVIKSENRVVSSSIMEATGISFASALGVSYHAEKSNKMTIAITDSFGIYDNLNHIEDIRDKNRKIQFIYLSEDIKSKNWNQDFLYPGSLVGRSFPIASDRIRRSWLANDLPYIKVQAEDLATLKTALSSNENSLLIEIPVSLTTQLIPRVSYDRSLEGKFRQNSLSEMEPRRKLPSFIEFMQGK
jgi:acetolactate synthase-1/2/3 large subunit